MKNVYDKFVIPYSTPLTQFEYKNTEYSLNININIGFDYKDYKTNKMNAKDLRIGNIIGYLEVDLNNGGLIINQYPCTLNDIAEIQRGNICNRYSKVPLTEKWLLDFGFKEEIYKIKNEYNLQDGGYEFPHGATKYTKDTCSILVLNNEFYYLLGFSPDEILDDYHCKKIEYVHQLQNLHLDIEEKELTLNK